MSLAQSCPASPHRPGGKNAGLGNVERFPGGLVSKAHRLFSRLKRNKEAAEEECRGGHGDEPYIGCLEFAVSTFNLKLYTLHPALYTLHPDPFASTWKDTRV